MSESDIKLWEEKAKSGLIKNDSTINNMLSKMRQDIYESVTGAGSIYEFGITTGGWRDNGKLQIDETKLKDALRSDSEKVLNTLFKTSSVPEQTINADDSDIVKAEKKALMDQRQAESGAFIRIYDNMTSGIKEIVSKSGPGSESTLLRSVKSTILIDYVTKGSKSLLDSDIGEIDKRIDRENQRLITIEQRYWKQFTAMEQAMSQMNSQSSWLSQQFGGQ
ncbi:Flagellar hook-associated protein 2 [bioreactor metagenome]|uniref:Flagellar hook-associated protein 2 n=2 Tax=root TaxID=1 RepID=A0A645FBS9_9ZZZZ